MSTPLAQITAKVDDDKERRRARKRATDRKAQKGHRERREAYVKQLESSIKTLTEQQTNDDRIKALLEENNILKEEQSRLRARLHRVHALTAACEPNTDGETNLESHMKSPPLRATVDVHESEDGFGDIAAAQIFYETGGVSANFADISDDRQVVDPFDGLDGSQSIEQSVNSNSLSIEEYFGTALSDFTAGQNRQDGNCRQVDGVPTSSETALVPQKLDSSLWALTTSNVSDNPLLCTNSHSKAMHDPLLEHISLPRYCEPIGPADKMLETFLEEARAEHRESRFDASEPTLSSLLSDPPKTVLAFRLFNFISGAGPMPLHIFLSVFWVQSLLLRVS
jgi:regulator of replication initiation timing